MHARGSFGRFVVFKIRVFAVNYDLKVLAQVLESVDCSDPDPDARVRAQGVDGVRLGSTLFLLPPLLDLLQDLLAEDLVLLRGDPDVFEEVTDHTLEIDDQDGPITFFCPSFKVVSVSSLIELRRLRVDLDLTPLVLELLLNFQYLIVFLRMFFLWRRVHWLADG